MKGKWKIVCVAILALCVFATFIAITRPKQTPAEVTYPPMLNAVLAHELTDPQAKLLSENGFAVEADVDFDPSHNWVTIYNLAKKYNLTLIAKIDSVTLPESFTIADWSQTVQRAVNDYGDIAHIWEIWNEPTYPANQIGYFNGSASIYTEMLKVAYQTIHASGANETVIGFGGLQMYSSFEPNPFNTWEDIGLRFAKNVTSLGGMNYCDAVGLHGYPWGGNYSSYVQKQFVNAIKDYREVTGKDVWITETGQTSGEYGRTQTDKANYLNETYTLFRSLGVKSYIWYELNDSPGRVASEGSFGLFAVNGSATEAFETYIKVTK